MAVQVTVAAERDSFHIPVGLTEITGAEWAIYQPEAPTKGKNAGKRKPPFCALLVTACPVLSDDSLGEPFTEAFAATLKREVKDFHPSADGETSAGSTPGVTGDFLVQVGEDPHMANISAAFMFIASLTTAGFKSSELDPPNGISAMVGTRGTVHHIKNGTFQKEDGTTGDYYLPLMKDIVVFPYETQAAPVTPVAAAKPGPKPPTPAPAAAAPAPAAVAPVKRGPGRPPAAAKATPAPAPVAAEPVGLTKDWIDYMKTKIFEYADSRKGKPMPIGMLVAPCRQAIVHEQTEPTLHSALAAACNTDFVVAVGAEYELFSVEDGKVVWAA